MAFLLPCFGAVIFILYYKYPFITKRRRFVGHFFILYRSRGEKSRKNPAFFMGRGDCLGEEFLEFLYLCLLNEFCVVLGLTEVGVAEAFAYHLYPYRLECETGE